MRVPIWETLMASRKTEKVLDAVQRHLVRSAWSRMACWTSIIRCSCRLCRCGAATLPARTATNTIERRRRFRFRSCKDGLRGLQSFAPLASR